MSGATAEQSFSGDARDEPDRTRLLTGGGWTAFFIGLAFLGSGFLATRTEIAGMFFHPSLLIAGPACFVGLVHRERFPRGVLAASLTLLLALTFVTAITTWTPSYSVRLAASLSCLLAGISLPRTKTDVEAGFLGMALSTGALAVLGLATNEDYAGGVEFMQAGNKNQYSMFALPALLGCVYFALGTRVSARLKLVFGAAAVALIAAILVSGNRSGWVGAALVVAAVMFGSRAALRPGTWLLGGLGAAAVLAVVTAYGTEAINDRYRISVEGAGSDTTRRRFIELGLRLFSEHPLLGLGPWDATVENARTFGIPMVAISPHNLTAFVLAGGGLALALPMLWLGWSLWQAPRLPALDELFVMSPRAFVRVFVVLWVVRAQFTEDVLFSPPMAFGVGLAVALARVAGRCGNEEAADDPALSEVAPFAHKAPLQLSPRSLSLAGPPHVREHRA